jgi:hypothetical protein
MFFPLRVEESQVAPGWFDIFMDDKPLGSRWDFDEPIASGVLLPYVAMMVRAANALIALDPENPLAVLESLLEMTEVGIYEIKEAAK